MEKIKPLARKQPVFFASNPRGQTLQKGVALAAEAISNYLARRGVALGYQDRITAYALRRRAASDLVQSVGYDLTRDIMGHAPETSELDQTSLYNHCSLDLRNPGEVLH